MFRVTTSWWYFLYCIWQETILPHRTPSFNHYLDICGVCFVSFWPLSDPFHNNQQCSFYNVYLLGAIHVLLKIIHVILRSQEAPCSNTFNPCHLNGSFADFFPCLTWAASGISWASGGTFWAEGILISIEEEEGNVVEKCEFYILCYLCLKPLAISIWRMYVGVFSVKDKYSQIFRRQFPTHTKTEFWIPTARIIIMR